MRRKNIIAAIVLIAFAAGYGFFTANLPDRTMPNTPGLSFFPWINTVMLLCLSVLLLLQGLRMPRIEGRAFSGRWYGAAWVLGAFVVYLAVMPGLGFVLATVPFFAVLMAIYGERRATWIGGGAVGATIFLYVLFRHGFGVFLPRGLLAGIVS